MRSLNLNTSHVKVNLLMIITIIDYTKNLNTSHVKVNPYLPIVH